MAAAGLGEWPPALREAVAAGEPLEPSLVQLVRDRWGVELRDGYGQTETTGQIGNPPCRMPGLGSMGLPLPAIGWFWSTRRPGVLFRRASRMRSA
ncbi:AMP-binding protein [Streptomyces sp. 8N616]|uniref:AMP-binding protein n=1 Tax=Streptomyces sp. 8N616 TaxID=3457414 RepID=UPI003FD20B1E